MPSKSTKSIEQAPNNNWLWVTKPDYYLDEDGYERRDLDPDSEDDTSGWWTCHKNTQRGDLILLWRTRPMSDIAYLIQARSDAYSISGEADIPGWDYGCDYLPLFKFESPLQISEVREDPYLNEWSAYRGKFQKRVFGVPPDIWEHLMRRLSEKNRDFAKFIRKIRSQNQIAPEILLEEDLENHLVENLHILSEFGYHLELVGRQVICTGHGGRIDLLCHDRTSKRYVVVELKNVRAGQNTFGQIMTYVGWVNEHFPKRKSALGLVIARGVDNRYLSAASTTPNVKHLTLEQLGFQ